ncbi:MAG: sodium ion-translocating decarboxylase subunit beta [Gammaproteobacteria bacterium]
MEVLSELVGITGLYALTLPQAVMMLVSGILLWLGIVKRFEPLLLVPIAIGGLLTNAPLAGVNEVGGFLHQIYYLGIETTLFPLIIFIGVGALTDFSPLLSNPKLVILGIAAQFGIFTTLFGAVVLSDWGWLDFSIQQAAAIGIIGGADGPTAIYVSSKLAPELLGAIAVSAYSYMALVPVIQPPIAKLLTTRAERAIQMPELRKVRPLELLLFPISLMLLVILLLPGAVPLVGALCFGNLLRVSGVVERLRQVASGALIDIVTLFLGLGVGSKLAADQFLQPETLGILTLGLFAFAVGTASGVLVGKLMNFVSSKPVNPLLGAAGVSAVPMAARVVTRMGQEENPNNILLMHAMGPNVAGVIGSAVVAGTLVQLLQ